MRRTTHTMGMIISLDIPASNSPSDFEKVFAELDRIDEKFSTYKPASEVSRYSRGELEENELSKELKEVIKACKDWDKKTSGHFSAWYGGSFDPSGYVKGWAIKRAGDIIKKLGYKTFCIGAGGDILANSDGERKWNIGIQDPKNRKKILDVLSISNGAVATSGTYERGEHILNPKTGQPANELLGITVTGPDIITADILATAAFVVGKSRGIKLVKKFPGYSATACL